MRYWVRHCISPRLDAKGARPRLEGDRGRVVPPGHPEGTGDSDAGWLCRACTRPIASVMRPVAPRGDCTHRDDRGTPFNGVPRIGPLAPLASVLALVILLREHHADEADDRSPGRAGRQTLARPDVERHAARAPRVDVQPQRRERLDGGAGRHARDLTIAPVLAAHTRSSGASGRIESRTLNCSFRTASGVLPEGGSMASRLTTCRRLRDDRIEAT